MNDVQPRHARLKALFDAALELDVAARPAWLADAARDDPGLADEVLALIAAHDEATTGFLAGTARDVLQPHSNLGLDRGWRVLRVIARGGMGVVYLAERADGAYEQRVALKLLRPSAIGTDAVQRVRLERQILARLSHANIARLVDGGTTPDGTPYFVMEYVEGERLDRWAEARRATIEARLRLFLAVCDAVAYAHRNLVVHRDLKPSNILVTADGTPKLLDFGIAKLIESDAGLTGEGERLLTPRYASPEQVRGEPVTTLSDVYSLGVVLYELLSGDSPYGEELSTPARLARAICERDPGAPSAVAGAARRRRLRGDLDAIVLRALRKAPGDRYPSVEALAADIEAFLARRPVAARRGDFAYRVRRFATRHWAALATTAGVIVLVAGFLVQLQRQLEATEVERDKSRHVVAFLTDLFRVADPSESRGNSVTVREVLDRGARTLTSDRTLDPAVRSTLLGSIARVYGQLGLARPSASLLDEALVSARAADARTLADTLASIGAIRIELGDFAGAETALTESARVQALGAAADDVLAARIRYHEGQLRLRQGRLDDAVAPLERSLDLRRRALGPQARETAESLAALAGVARDRGDLAAADAGMREALAIVDATGGDPWTRAKLKNNLAVIAGDRGDFAAAEASFRDVHALLIEALGDEHPMIAVALGNVASIVTRRGAYEEAQPLLEQAVALRRATLGEQHPSTATSLANLAYNRYALGDFEAAERELEQALAMQASLAPEHLHRASTLRNLAAVRFARGDLARAKEASDAILAAHGPASDPHPIVLQARARSIALSCFADRCDAEGLEAALDAHVAKLGDTHAEAVETQALGALALAPRDRTASCARIGRLEREASLASATRWDADLVRAFAARCSASPAPEAEAALIARYGATHPLVAALGAL